MSNKYDLKTGKLPVVINPFKYAEKILCTKGNCDAEVDEMISDFKFESKILININGVDFFFSHGHIYIIQIMYHQQEM